MRSFLVGMLVVVAVAATGCGGGGSATTNASDNGEASKAATEVITDSVKAAEAASSLRMSGLINASGQAIGIDLTIAKGTGAQGSLTLKGHKVDVVIVGGYGYMKADAGFWKAIAGSSGGAIATLLKDKWLKFPTNNPQFGSMTAIADPKGIFDNIKSSTGTPKNNGATTYKGQNVVAIAGGPSKGTFYVASTGTPYPVALVKTGSGSGGALVFSDWNQPVTITAPTDAVDLSKLTGA